MLKLSVGPSHCWIDGHVSAVVIFFKCYDTCFVFTPSLNTLTSIRTVFYLTVTFSTAPVDSGDYEFLIEIDPLSTGALLSMVSVPSIILCTTMTFSIANRPLEYKTSTAPGLLSQFKT